MQLPDTVQITGKTYKVIPKPTSWGGKSCTATQELSVGTKKDQTKERIFENFIHELIEVAMCEHHFRFTATDDGVVYVMAHKDLDYFANSIAAALLPMVKEQQCRGTHKKRKKHK